MTHEETAFDKFMMAMPLALVIGLCLVPVVYYCLNPNPSAPATVADAMLLGSVQR